MSLLCRLLPRPSWFALGLVWVLGCCVVGSAWAQPEESVPGGGAPAPAGALEASDHPGDNGNAIDLRWTLSTDDRAEFKPRRVKGYRLERRALPSAVGGADGEGATDEMQVTELPYGMGQFVDRQCVPGRSYQYRLWAVGPGGESAAIETDGPVTPQRQWWDGTRTGFAVVLLTICGAVIWFTERAKRGKSLHVREIAALRAMQEAVGRATEMGRPCLFIPGIEDMNEIATVAGVAILSHVAETAADYQAEIVVPTTRSLVMTAAQEAVWGAYLKADRADDYRPDHIYYVSDEQFAYVAHVTGYMVREKPAACFYTGVFYAESLIFAETGNSVGAIQIAGTSEATQLPFFVAGCDYTLMGEELFAASAYLTREPQQLGSLKGQDAGKVLAVGLLLAGCLLATAVEIWPGWDPPVNALRWLTGRLLGGG
ncbi:MAG: DUF6754 domain-containing protein [Planctomycetaceae bacterium]|jgi:hypothetical protein